MDLITVFIAEAHVVLRQRLKRILVQQQNMQVVGEATDVPQVLRQVEALQPHILLLDLRMPMLGGFELLPRLRAQSPMTKILLLDDYCADDFIASTLQAGVHGCVLKTAPPTELVKAIRTTHAGELWVSRRLLTLVVEAMCQRMSEWEGSVSELWGLLSNREREVVLWAAQGMTNREIAAQLGISAKTVKTHLQKVFEKLNIRRRAHLSRFCHTSFQPPAVSPPSALRREG